jgi:hypothetical protein
MLCKRPILSIKNTRTNTNSLLQLGFIYFETHIGQTILEKYKMFCKDDGFAITTTMRESRTQDKSKDKNLVLNYNKVVVDMKALFTEFAYFFNIFFGGGHLFLHHIQWSKL